MDKVEILKQAMILACRYMRENLPAGMPEGDFSDIVWAFIDGKSDPTGVAFLTYFWTKAEKMLDNQQQM